MITTSTSPTVSIRQEPKNYTVFASISSVNSVCVSNDGSTRVLETKASADVLVQGVSNDPAQVLIQGAPQTTVVSSEPSTVFKVFDGAAEVVEADSQVMKGQIVAINGSGKCSPASSSDPSTLYLPLKVAKSNAAAGESVVIGEVSGEIVTAFPLVVGEPVFLGEDGWAVSKQNGLISVALGVATGLNKFYGRTGQRMRLNN